MHVADCEFFFLGHSCAENEIAKGNIVPPSEIIDIGAAIGAGCGVLLALGPVGWKVWAAVIVGGADSGSTINALDQLWP